MIFRKFVKLFSFSSVFAKFFLLSVILAKSEIAFSIEL